MVLRAKPSWYALAMRSLTPPARRYLLFTALLTFGSAVSSLYYNLLVIALGFDVRTVAVPLLGRLSVLGLLNSLPTLVAGASGVVVLWLVNRFGPRPTLIAGAALGALGLLGTALGTTPRALLLAAAVSGPANVMLQISGAPFMMRHSGPGERDRLFALSAGLTVGVGGVGSLVAGLIPGLLVRRLGLAPQSADVYRATLVVPVVCCVVAALVLARGPRRPNARHANIADNAPPPAAPPLREQLRAARRAARAALPYTISPLLIGFGAALLIPFLNVYFRQRYDASDEALGLIFAAIGIATGAATLAAPPLSRRIGRMGSVVLTQSLAVPCLLLLGAAPVLWLAAAVALVRNVLMNMAAPLYDAYAMERSDEAARPITIGLINGAFAVGFIAGPTISAEVQRRVGFGPLFVATAGFYASSAVALYLLFLRGRPRDVLP